MWFFHGSQFGLEFFAGWLTEYSLSVDNLFIFLIIMASFNVPKKYQQQALLVGIILALIFRGIFIALGAVAINQFSWIFYALRRVPGLHRDHAGPRHRPRRRRRELRGAVRAQPPEASPTSGTACKLWVKENGKRLMTPMFLVIVALGTTDLLFALDSIPAIYGLTQRALPGVHRQRVRADGSAPAVLPARRPARSGWSTCRRAWRSSSRFIGVKLILHALHENELPFINGGEHVPVPEIPTLVSLGVIIVTLVITTVASLYKTRVHDVRKNGSGAGDTEDGTADAPLDSR